MELIAFFHSGDLSNPPQHRLLFIFSCGFDCLLLCLPDCSLAHFQCTLLWSILLLWIQVTILLKMQLFFLVPCLPNVEPNNSGDYCSNPGTKNAYVYSCKHKPDRLYRMQSKLDLSWPNSLLYTTTLTFSYTNWVLENSSKMLYSTKKLHHFYWTDTCSCLKFRFLFIYDSMIYLPWSYFKISTKEFFSYSFKDWTEGFLFYYSGVFYLKYFTAYLQISCYMQILHLWTGYDLIPPYRAEVIPCILVM